MIIIEEGKISAGEKNRCGLGEGEVGVVFEENVAYTSLRSPMSLAVPYLGHRVRLAVKVVVDRLMTEPYLC